MNQMPQSARDRINLLISASKEYEAQAEQIQMQLELIGQSMAATRITGETIEQLKDLQDGQEILLPLGNLAFIKAKIMDSSNVIVNVGASINIEKPNDKAKEDIDKRLEELTKSQMQLRQALQQIIQKVQQIRNEIEKVATAMQQGQQPPAVGS
ncbi:MAG: prefoldin subunit alpha [Candidatus Helarchaeota archaeon]|nr:prefoldin subunit alpha [Candidatus Helarchaeota archaeon]